MQSFYRAAIALSGVVFFAASGAVGSTEVSPNAMNPAVSLDGLFGFSQFNRSEPLVFDGGHDPKINGFNLQQVELTLGSNVDPYLRADANLVLTHEGIEIEEAYATTLGLPGGLQVRAGQFFTALGRSNPTHPHTWAFVNKPLVMGRFFGGDGLRNPGAELSWLTPLPWYSEIVVSAQNSTGETAPSFIPDGQMRSLRDALAMARIKSFFSWSDSLSLQLGASILNGGNSDSARTRTRIYGGDLYLKYRNPESLSFVSLTIEALKRYYDQLGDEPGKDWGWYAELAMRFGAPWERWHFGLRFDQVSARALGAPSTSVIPASGEDQDGERRWRVSPVLTFYPSEFSKLRLQYDHDKPMNFAAAQKAVTLQFEFLIGAHGAHKF